MVQAKAGSGEGGGEHRGGCCGGDLAIEPASEAAAGDGALTAGDLGGAGVDDEYLGVTAPSRCYHW